MARKSAKKCFEVVGYKKERTHEIKVIQTEPFHTRSFSVVSSLSADELRDFLKKCLEEKNA